MIPSIPTTYGGINYRSQHEARWAAMFDAAGWNHTYEPFAGNSYIPDFLIGGPSPFLVEVKPAVTGEEYRAPIPKIVRGMRDHWQHDVLIVGAAVSMIFDEAGILVDFLGGPEDWNTSIARWVYCPECVALGIAIDNATHIRPCGHDTPNGGTYDHHKLTKAWATACNLVQWRPAA